jgi:hypothetical protein
MTLRRGGKTDQTSFGAFDGCAGPSAVTTAKGNHKSAEKKKRIEKMIDFLLDSDRIDFLGCGKADLAGGNLEFGTTKSSVVRN